MKKNFSASFYRTLAKELIVQKKWNKATQALKKAINLEPNNCWSYELLARSLTHIDNPSNLDLSRTEIKEHISIYQTFSKHLISKTHPNFVGQKNQKELSGLPNFLVIGQQKCGTTFLYYYLIQHPNILPSVKKEIHFWEDNFNLGLDWYAAHFPYIEAEQNYITGEATANYINSLDIAENIYKYIPNLKLIVLLRNPIDRTISNYYMNYQLKIENRSLEEAVFCRIKSNGQPAINNCINRIGERQYLTKSKYINLITQWMKVFPREQFLIVRSEDLFKKPDTTMSHIFDFLEVDMYQIAEYKKINLGSYPSISDSNRQALGSLTDGHISR